LFSGKSKGEERRALGERERIDRERRGRMERGKERGREFRENREREREGLD